MFEKAGTGTGSSIENQRMFLDRHGYLEEAFMTFSFSPIRDESGGVGGLFHPIAEVTEKLLSARRTQTLRELSALLGNVKAVEDIGAALTQLQPDTVLDTSPSSSSTAAMSPPRASGGCPAWACPRAPRGVRRRRMSPRRALDDAYRNFYEQLQATVTHAVVSVRA
ncbi:hypothetical protein [Corallococcus sp. EGB]|uniref:hypothetical protein n=1 Tax=Corallococcus sp. EGB TaxID=1521117 RepID=UPI001CBFE34E|nr:hypothetical protein [Corallococcus sp. EGB]